MPDAAPPQPPGLRAFGDVDATRGSVYDAVHKAASSLPDRSDDRHTLRLTNVRYVDPDRVTKRAHKAAILSGETVGRRLKGTWELYDNATGKKVDSRDQVIARVPHLLDLGTYTHHGNDYTVHNQQRLRPGVFARRKANGELEAHANVAVGTGPSHRYALDPAKGIFKIEIGQASMPLMPLLRQMGATDRELRDAWGPALHASNARVDDPSVLRKLKERILRKRDRTGDEAGESRSLADAFGRMELDPWVTARTLGHPHARVDKDAILATTRKLLAVSRGEQEPDDRDHLAYQRVLGPEDLMHERVARDHGRIQHAAFRKVSAAGNLAKMPSGLLTAQLDQVLTGSGLGQAIEETNPVEILDKQSRISRMGEGGIGSLEAIPAESRGVQPSHYGFLDALRTPESFRAGVDLNIARGARKGPDGQIYAPWHNPRTRQVEWKTPQELADVPLAFPGWHNARSKRVPVLLGGQHDFAHKRDVAYAIPHMEEAFSHLGNLVPLKSMVKGQRVAMASRMLTQALPLVEPEAPHVRGGVPGTGEGRSFEEEYGKHAGAVHADKPGRVEKFDPETHTLHLRYEDGTRGEVELYDTHPFNRKTFLHQTPTVEPGQPFHAGDLLARSNYTDSRGVTALGLNARTAYLPWHGLNFEDAIVISEGMAHRLSSEHAYQHDLEVTDRHKTGKGTFTSLFPSRYGPDALAKLDDRGIVRPGQTVGFGEPLILAAREKELAQNKVHRQRQPGHADESVTWKHHDPGVVTDVVWGKSGPTVLVKAVSPMRVGDKMSGRYGDKGIISAIVPDHEMPHGADGNPYEVLLNPLGITSRCYDAETEFLTASGWKYGAEVVRADQLVCYHPWTENLYVLDQLEPMHTAHYKGTMLKFANKLMDFCVTPNHRMWTRCSYPGAPWQEETASRIFGKGWTVPVAGNAIPGVETAFVLPHVSRAVKDTQSARGEIVIDAGDWAEFLGWYVAEGNTDTKVHLSQSWFANPAKCERIAALLDRLPFGWNYNRNNIQFHISSLRLCAYLAPLGLCADKYIPDWVFQQPVEIRQRFLDAYWAGDGRVTEYAADKFASSANSRSRRLVDDLQRLLIYQGVSSNRYDVPVKPPSGPMWRCARHFKKTRVLEPCNWRRIKYDGTIYCPTVPTGYVVTRRNGKVLIAGNTNPAQKAELWLGKIAAHTGKPVTIEDFAGRPDMIEHVRERLAQHGLPDTEDLVDPARGRKIRGVPTGSRFFMKLMHVAECFDDKTEVLTAEGWLPWPHITPLHRLGTLDGDKLVFERPICVVQAPSPGTLYCFAGRYIDYAVTGEHRHYVRAPFGDPPWKMENASILHGRRFCVRQFGFAACDGVATERVVFGGLSLSWMDYAELVAWWATEGYSRVSHRTAYVTLYRSETANPEKLAAIVALADRIGVPWHYYRANGQIFGVTLSHRDLATALKHYGTHSYNKRLPRDLFTAPLDARKRAVEIMLDGDGSRQEQLNGTSVRFVSTSRGLADDFQELCIRNGSGAVVRPNAPRKERHYLPSWTCGVATRRTDALVDGTRRKCGFSLRPYQGIIYCAEMRTGLLYVRRNGKPMLTGNSKAQGRGSGGYTADEQPSKGGETGCFVGDTPIVAWPLGAGRPLAPRVTTIRELAEGRDASVVSSRDRDAGADEHGRVTDGFRFRVSPRELIEVELENGARFVATRTHWMILADGESRQAGALRVGDDLME